MKTGTGTAWLGALAQVKVHSFTYLSGLGPGQLLSSVSAPPLPSPHSLKAPSLFPL